jgi:phosphopantetheinyl transferase
MRTYTKSKYLNSCGSALFVWQDIDYLKNLSEGRNKRNLEKETVKHKLESIGNDFILEHDDNGAPLILNSPYSHISISHYRGYFAVYLANKPIGVDIQVFKNSLFKGRSYFVNNHEESTLELSKINLHIIWSAKEAFFKRQLGKISDLKNEVVVVDIDTSKNNIIIKFDNEYFELCFEVYSKYVVIWTS